jgi:hypothetical protein
MKVWATRKEQSIIQSGGSGGIRIVPCLHAGWRNYMRKKRQWKEAAHWMEMYRNVEPAATGHELALLGDYFMADMDLDKALASFKSALEKDPYTFWLA